jgi:hypothetical protein
VPRNSVPSAALARTLMQGGGGNHIAFVHRLYRDAAYILAAGLGSGAFGFAISGRHLPLFRRLAFVQEIGGLAEAEGHHPNISFGWGNATVSLQTKKIKGLHENDFIVATKIDRIFARTSAA